MVLKSATEMKNLLKRIKSTFELGQVSVNLKTGQLTFSNLRNKKKKSNEETLTEPQRFMGFHQEYQHIHNVSFSRRDRKSDGIFEKRMAKKIPIFD